MPRMSRTCARYASHHGNVMRSRPERLLDWSRAERLKAVDTSEISPTASTLPLIGVQRDDVIRPGLTTDEALANAPKGGRDGEFFRVQEILEGR
ncbi:MAG: hypothetical protein E6J35_12390 [Chloroflexi bacterium]|nr:MAG: hypothetical protein E6J35_12390 [Chloroflexota bacterium]